MFIKSRRRISQRSSTRHLLPHRLGVRFHYWKVIAQKHGLAKNITLRETCLPAARAGRRSLEEKTHCLHLLTLEVSEWLPNVTSLDGFRGRERSQYTVTCNVFKTLDAFWAKRSSSQLYLGTYLLRFLFYFNKTVLINYLKTEDTVANLKICYLIRNCHLCLGI